MVRPFNVIFKALFDEGQGTMAHDYSSYGASITLKGNVAWVKDSGWGGTTVSYATNTWSPTTDGAVYVPEVDTNYLETAPTNRFDFQGNDFSILMQVSKEKRGTNVSLLNFTDTCSGESFDLGVTAANQVHFTLCGIAQKSWVTFPDFSKPMHLVVTKNSAAGGTIKLYLNGKLDATFTGTGNLQAISTNRRLLMGSPNPSGRTAFLGKIGKVIIWNATLTDAEVKFMWTQQFGPQAMR